MFKRNPLNTIWNFSKASQRNSVSKDVERRQLQQLVKGPITEIQMRQSDVKVTLDGESVAVTGPLTDTQLRASDVKITLDSEAVAVTNVYDDITNQYKISDIDSTNGYYGFVDAAGNWYIMKETSTSYRYVKGTSGYTTAWTNRASQSYDYFYTTF